MNLYAPPLTVALLTYNRLHYLREALEAILSQTYQDFELLVLDNGSSDGTAAYVLGITDPRIRYVRNARNFSTVQFNCCSAYALALGRRVIATHDDDIMEPDMLARQMAFMDMYPHVRLVWTRVSDIDHESRFIQEDTLNVEEDRLFAPGEYVSSFLKERLWPMPSGVMLERRCLPSMYRLDTIFRERRQLKNPMDAAGIADVLLPARVNRRHAIGYIGTPLLRRRVHTKQFTHAASLSRPGVYLYRRLKRIAAQTPGAHRQVLSFDTFVARFEIQEAITTQATAHLSKGLRSRVEHVVQELAKAVPISPDAVLAGLPIILLHGLLIGAPAFTGLAQLSADGYSSATQKMLAWARWREAVPSACLLQAVAGRRVVIFGSAFVAALLILEARNVGQQVWACVDSNTSRQGRYLLTVPIHPLTWLMENVGAEDVVVLSSERDHEHYMAALLRGNLRHRARILSWKDLLTN